MRNGDRGARARRGVCRRRHHERAPGRRHALSEQSRSARWASLARRLPRTRRSASCGEGRSSRHGPTAPATIASRWPRAGGPSRRRSPRGSASGIKPRSVRVFADALSRRQLRHRHRHSLGATDDHLECRSCPPPGPGEIPRLHGRRRARANSSAAAGLRSAGVAGRIRVVHARRRDVLRWERRISSSWRRRPTCSAATTSGCAISSGLITSTSTRRNRCVPRGVRSGSASTSRFEERWAARRAGSAARSGCSSATGATARSAATCCCPSCSSTRRRATSRLPLPPPRRPRRSASASATRTCSRSRPTGRATC